jgi:hypothetical protein
MFTQVAVVPLDDSSGISPEVLLPIVAAIQVQVQRDLGPTWDVHAAVSAFTSLDQVPQGAWPVAVADPKQVPVDGFHFVMNGLPFAVVGNSEQLSLNLSHEIAEMLVDANGLRTVAGPSPLDQTKTVQYFVEVCDACEHETYNINGVEVADFVLPGYYDHDGDHLRARGYSFTGAVSNPRQVLNGGYVTWREPFPGDTVSQAFGLTSGISPKATQLAGAKPPKITKVQNPGSAGKAKCPDQLQVMPLANAPTRAWREYVAELARSDEPAPEKKGYRNPAYPDQFAKAFATNVKALLPVLRNQKPPPSIAEVIAAIKNPHSLTYGQTGLGKPPKVTPDTAKKKRKIIRYLEQQQRLAGIFGPDLDSGLASWMFMIMP